MKKPKGIATGGAVIKVRSPGERGELMKRFRKITGMSTESAAQRIIAQVSGMSVWGRESTTEQKILQALDLIGELKPATGTEALLAVQMFGVHEAALSLLQRATLREQTVEGVQAAVLLSTRLMRLFNEQVELMSKLKGKPSRQRVTVEHVHVYQGGQAIVGAVSAARTDRREGGK